jgi:hypothetical protein
MHTLNCFRNPTKNPVANNEITFPKVYNMAKAPIKPVANKKDD